jgi:hypothetical protein
MYMKCPEQTSLEIERRLMTDEGEGLGGNGEWSLTGVDFLWGDENVK